MLSTFEWYPGRSTLGDRLAFFKKKVLFVKVPVVLNNLEDDMKYNVSNFLRYQKGPFVHACIIKCKKDYITQYMPIGIFNLIDTKD